VTSCSQLLEIEELVLGDLPAGRSDELLAHVEGCQECRAELTMVTAERALFVRRAEVAPGPPAALAIAVRERVTAQAVDARASTGASVTHLASRFASALRRGHVSVAFAAALFIVAGFSRLGGVGDGSSSTMSAPETMTAVDGETRGDLSSKSMSESTRKSGFASLLHEDSLACEELNACRQGASSAHETRHDTSHDTMASLERHDEGIACDGHGPAKAVCEAASCEPSVTCSSLRQ
jgi:hypothetical protein